jgi:chromosome segregation ATPase
MRMDFEQQENQFLDEVDDLNAFDVILRKAQEKLSDVKNDVDELEQEKDRFCWEIDILGQQQEELEHIVNSFESQFNLQTQQDSTSIGALQVSTSSNNATPADLQRDNMYFIKTI